VLSPSVPAAPSVVEDPPPLALVPLVAPVVLLAVPPEPSVLPEVTGLAPFESDFLSELQATARAVRDARLIRIRW
jgi:hypothetical protein